MRIAPRNVKPDRTLWLDVDAGVGYVDGNNSPGRLPVTAGRVELEATLDAARRCGATRVMLTGRPIPREWLLAVVPGWTHGRHHLDHETPTGRYSTDDGTRVEIKRAAEWFGRAQFTPLQARAAWQATGHVLEKSGRGGAAMFRAPGATGLDLWLRAANAEVPEPASVGVQDLIRATSPQHRIELHAPAVTEAPALWIMDGRWMYAALTSQLGSGEPQWRRGPDAAEHFAAHPYARGRYLVKFAAPPFWRETPHAPGLLMARTGESATDGWHCPTDGETWADSAELHVAVQYGWQLTFVEGMVWPAGKPLDTWTARLVRARDAVSDAELGPDVAALVRGAVRAVMLYAVGAWHSAGADEVTVTASPMERPDGDDWDAPEMLATGGALWRRRTATQDARALSMRHPEWSSQIWGRAHARMLEGPTGTPGRSSGMLHTAFSAGSLVGCYGDALMLTSRPVWADHDDGRPGRLRVKGHLCGPVAWPTSARERDALTLAAEAAGATCTKGCN